MGCSSSHPLNEATFSVLNDRPNSVQSLALAGEKNKQKKTSDFLVRLFTCRQEEDAQKRLVSLCQVQRPCPHLSELVTKAFVFKFVSSEPCPMTSVLVSVCLLSETLLMSPLNRRRYVTVLNGWVVMIMTHKLISARYQLVKKHVSDYVSLLNAVGNNIQTDCFLSFSSGSN